ncbi:MAG: HAD-IA family hydrolase [Bacteroidales bacterium]|nr:HAD-IA family hydrolase [Candidatus Cryptobacteroides aphodequi]
MFKLAMFDMDGVLLDSMPRHAACWSIRFREDYGFEIPVSEVYANEGRSSRDFIASIIRKYFNREAPQEEVDAMYRRKCATVDSRGGMPPMPGALEAVKAVRAQGMEAVVVTGSGHTKLLNFIKEAYPGLFHTDWMVCANDGIRCKPNPDPYLAGLRNAGGIDPSEAIVIENAPLGVQAGKAAGCYVIAVNTGPLPDAALFEAGADVVLHSMFELAEMICTLRESLA